MSGAAVAATGGGADVRRGGAEMVTGPPPIAFSGQARSLVCTFFYESKIITLFQWNTYTICFTSFKGLKM